MSYNEYLDLFYNAQQTKCPYRAFCFDVINSRKEEDYIFNHENYLKFALYMYDLLLNEEKLTNKSILLKDENNKKNTLSKKFDINQNNYNPMILGDCFTYYVYNNSITENRMIELFNIALEKFKINYAFHFNSGVYETNNYALGNKKLYKGYMLQILESLSKKNGKILKINKDIQK